MHSFVFREKQIEMLTTGTGSGKQETDREGVQNSR